jgi:tetratricopeptide (TPR) repeat protein
MLRKMLLLVALFCTLTAWCQQDPIVVDSMKKALVKLTKPEERIEALGALSQTLMNTSMPEAEAYGKQMIREAEMSRDRRLMAKAYRMHGESYAVVSFNREFVTKANENLNKALDIARKNKITEEVVGALTSLSYVETRTPNADKALAYSNQAFSQASLLRNDSLLAVVYLSFGSAYQLKKERLTALRNYLNALQIAERIDNALLKRAAYSSLSSFYSELKDYDKAIDYAEKGKAQLPFIKKPNAKYNEVIDLFTIGNIYVQKKDFDMSVFYFNRSIALADSLKYPPLKMPGYNGLLMQYISSKQPQKALEFFNRSKELKDFLINYRMGHVIDGSYAGIYTELKQFDSAKKYFDKAAAAYEQSNPAYRINFYMSYAEYYKESKNPQQALAYLLKAKELADQTANLSWQRSLAKELDSTYMRNGDFKLAYEYKSLYNKYDDSLKKLGEEKELMQVEMQDEEIRAKRIQEEKEKALREKHQVQYMGITIGIAAIFTLLVLLGVFQVSETTIKVIGFFAFILLFEFIILIADTKIHHMTHGEPLPILGIKIILIAMLLPLHHWLEHKVVKYLTSRRLIIPTGKSIWRSLVSRNKEMHN